MPISEIATLVIGCVLYSFVSSGPRPRRWRNFDGCGLWAVGRIEEVGAGNLTDSDSERAPNFRRRPHYGGGGRGRDFSVHRCGRPSARLLGVHNGRPARKCSNRVPLAGCRRMRRDNHRHQAHISPADWSPAAAHAFAASTCGAAAAASPAGADTASTRSMTSCAIRKKKAVFTSCRTTPPAW